MSIIRKISRAGMWIGSLSFGILIIALISNGANDSIVYGIMASLLLTVLSATLHGFTEEDVYV